MVNEQEGHRILKEDVRGKTKDLESLKEEIEVIKKTKRVLELRKDGNAEMSAEIKKSEDELLLLEKCYAATKLHAMRCTDAGHAAARKTKRSASLPSGLLRYLPTRSLRPVRYSRWVQRYVLAPPCLVLAMGTVLRACSAVSGTGSGYGATRLVRRVRY
eukprot:1426501-Rhodomonas_salina.1